MYIIYNGNVCIYVMKDSFARYDIERTLDFLFNFTSRKRYFRYSLVLIVYVRTSINIFYRNIDNIVSNIDRIIRTYG